MYGDPDAGYSSDTPKATVNRPKPRPTSSGGFSQSGAQISADVSKQKDIQRYKSTGSKGGNTPSYVSQGGGGGSRELTSTGYKSTGSGRSGSGNKSAANKYKSTGSGGTNVNLGFGNTGSSGTNVNLGFGNIGNSGPGIKAIADNLLGIGGRTASQSQSQALASNQLRSGAATPDWNRIYPGYQNIPAPDPYYGAPDAMTVAPTPPVAQGYFDTPLTAGAPDGTPNLALQQYIPWDNSGGYLNIDGLNRSDTPDIGPGFGMVGMGRPAMMPSNTATMAPNAVRDAITRGIETANAREATSVPDPNPDNEDVVKEYNIPSRNLVGSGRPALPVGGAPAAPAEGPYKVFETPAAAAARMKANMGKQGVTPPPYDPDAPVLDMRDPIIEPVDEEIIMIDPEPAPDEIIMIDPMPQADADAASPSVDGEFGDSYESRRDIPWWANTIAGAVNPLFGLAGMGINAMGGIPLGDPNNPAERYVSSAQRPNGDSRLRGDEGQNQDPDATDIPADAPSWWPPGLPWPPVSPTTGPVVPPYVPTPTVPAPPTPYYFSHPTVSAAGAAGLAGMPGAPWQ
jgi:hypothetical protein